MFVLMMTFAAVQKGEPMADLIERQAAIDAAKRLLDYYGTNEITKEFADNSAENFMNCIPPAQQVTGKLNSDCISRQAAIDAICKEGTRLERNGIVAMCEIKQWCVDLLERLPSAQPEIILCKDCEHNSNPPESGNALCDKFYGMTDQMGYCHHAKRRADDQNL